MLMETTTDLTTLLETLDTDEIIIIGKQPLQEVNAADGTTLVFHSVMGEKLAHALMKAMIANPKILEQVKELFVNLGFCINTVGKELAFVGDDIKKAQKWN